MCEPISAIMSIASTVLSTVAGIAGQARQAASQQAMQGYQAAVARNNQIAAERLAQDAEQRGEIAEQRQRSKTAQLLGRQTAVLAAQGTDLSGSPIVWANEGAALSGTGTLTYSAGNGGGAKFFRVVCQ